MKRSPEIYGGGMETPAKVRKKKKKSLKKRKEVRKN